MCNVTGRAWDWQVHDGMLPSRGYLPLLVPTVGVAVPRGFIFLATTSAIASIVAGDRSSFVASIESASVVFSGSSAAFAGSSVVLDEDSPSLAIAYDYDELLPYV